MTATRVLVVDDDPSSNYLLQSILKSGGYEVLTSEDGVEALEVARYESPDLVVTDILMPRMDGYQLCREWRADAGLAQIPFVFYTANYAEAEDERFALSLGADLFLRKPSEPDAVLAEIGDLLGRQAAGTLPPRRPASKDENRVLKEYNARLVNKLEQQLIELHEANDLLTQMLTGTVHAIGKLTEARDPYTSGHQERVAAIAWAIAEKLGHDRHFGEGIRIAALLHDIGKIYVPAEILARPRRLTEVELGIVRMHPQVAYEVLTGIMFPWPVADYVVQHHERLDGSGYPAGLSGDAILPGSRIIAVADVVEAIASHRPYKTAAGIAVALDEIDGNAGTLYDTDVAAACLALFDKDGFEIPEPSAGAGGAVKAYSK
ncbi:MAG: response regulator [Coriobacteriia bacterium]|nr:response regulator [Coriobacteriia bacterium]